MNSKLKIGILGGGQLARMLVLEGHKLGPKMYVLCSSKEDPAAQVTSYWVPGDPDKSEDVEAFLLLVDRAIFESEFLNAEMLADLSSKTQTPIWPKPETMGLLQDRLTQKQSLLKAKIPSAPFLPVKTFSEAEQALHEWPRGLVLKKRRFGYDGYGTFMVASQQELERLKTIIEKENFGFIAEPRLRFKRELALLAARSSKGEFMTFPLVETRQVDSRCFWVKGPVKHPQAGALIQKVKSCLRNLNYVGVVAFELFDLGKELVVNEIAPRVHNSGHYSLDALDENQFSAHLKAGLGAKLMTPRPLSPGFAMVNCLGESQNLPDWEFFPGTFFHWYGKSENRPGRKMGHINAVAKTAEQALKLALKARKRVRL